MATYPKRRQSCMLPQPPDPAFAVEGGELLYSNKRDARFPYLYSVPSHPLTHNNAAVTRVLVYIQDTSKEALEALYQFEEELYVPLGPDNTMEGIGLFDMEDGTVIFARAVGCNAPALDAIIAWCFIGERMFNSYFIQQLAAVRDAILGPHDLMSLTTPITLPDGTVVGSTFFERLGQIGVKLTRCYSLTLSMQHWKNRVGPTAGSKIHNYEMSINEVIRRDTVKISTELAMKSLYYFLPPKFLKLLQDNADANNLPRIGVADNFAFPAVQLNISPAVAYSDCYKKGLQGMGEFGQVDGHRDRKDSPAALTCMISNSRLPEGYECGRFHLLGLGVYVRLVPTTLVNFCGLNKHGGSPPIAPEGEEVANHAYRLMNVCYPPQSMISGAGVSVVPLASLPKKMVLKLGPEITTHLSFAEQQAFTNEACWTLDGPAVMDRKSHFDFVARSSYQLFSYVFQQLPPSYEANLDSRKFLEAASMVAEEDNTNSNEEGSSSNVPRRRITASPWPYAPDGALADRHVSQEADNAIVGRRELLFQFLDHMEDRSRFIPMMSNADFDAEREKVNDGQLGIRNAKGKTGNGKKRTAPSDNLDERQPSKRLRGENLQHVAAGLQDHLAQAGKATVISTKPPTRPAPVPTKNHSSATKAKLRSSTKKQAGPPRKRVSVVIDRSRYGSELRSVVEAAGVDVPTQSFDDKSDGASDDDEDNSDNDSDSDSDYDGSTLSSSETEDEDDSPGIQWVNEVVEGTSIGATGIASLHPDDDNDQSAYEENNGDETLINKINSVLQDLNVDTISSAIAEYEEVLQVTNRTLSTSSFESTSAVCTLVLESIANRPADASTAVSITNFWGQLNDMHDLSLLARSTARTTCALYMLSSWSTMDWITRTVADGIGGKHGNTWMTNLINDVRSAIQTAHQRKQGGRETRRTTQKRETSTLVAAKYLPDLVNASPFTFDVPRLLLDQSSQNKSIQGVVTRAIEQWLNFPKTPSAVVRNALIASLMTCGSIAVLYLDRVWEVFQNPYKHVIGGPTTNRRPSAAYTKHAIATFDALFAKHPIMDHNSETRHKLDRLEDIIFHGKWAKGVPPKRAKKSTVGAPINLASPADPRTPAKGERFLQFLREFVILATEGVGAHINSRNKYIRKTARNPDRFLPFRSKAPTFQRALTTILSDTDRMASVAGLFNLAAFRGIFFGSTFAREELRWFSDLDEWQSYKHETQKTEEFFVYKNAYGTHQLKRNTEHLSSLWDVAAVEWIPHIRNTNSMFDLVVLYRFFKKHLYNIGPLASLLMVGDLIDSGVLPMPTPSTMGKLVATVNKGAAKGLRKLGFVSDWSSRTEVEEAFVQLHTYLLSNLTDGEKETMGYNVVMLEHALCKIQRIYKSRRVA